MVTNKPRILIVEDEESIRRGLSDVLVYHGYDVDTAADGKVGLEKALSRVYHLLILDIMLPELDGMSICRKVREKDRAQPILMLTAKGDEEDIIAGLKAGADDYVPKPFSIREFLARVEAVLRRSQKLTLDNKKILWGTLVIDPTNLILEKNGKSIELTRREVDILAYLIKSCDQPVGRTELLKEVWGYNNSQMDTRTVDIHITKLRRKIEEDPQNPTIILTIRGEGYKIFKT